MEADKVIYLNPNPNLEVILIVSSCFTPHVPNLLNKEFSLYLSFSLTSKKIIFKNKCTVTVQQMCKASVQFLF